MAPCTPNEVIKFCSTILKLKNLTDEDQCQKNLQTISRWFIHLGQKLDPRLTIEPITTKPNYTIEDFQKMMNSLDEKFGAATLAINERALIEKMKDSINTKNLVELQEWASKWLQITQYYEELNAAQEQLLATQLGP